MKRKKFRFDLAIGSDTAALYEGSGKYPSRDCAG